MNSVFRDVVARLALAFTNAKADGLTFSEVSGLVYECVKGLVDVATALPVDGPAKKAAVMEAAMYVYDEYIVKVPIPGLSYVPFGSSIGYRILRPLYEVAVSQFVEVILPYIKTAQAAGVGNAQ